MTILARWWQHPFAGTSRSRRRVYFIPAPSAAATPLGCRTNACLAQSQPPLGKGFRGVNRERQGVGLYRLSATADQKISLTYALQSVKA